MSWLALKTEKNKFSAFFLSQQPEPSKRQRVHHREDHHLTLNWLCPVQSSVQQSSSFRYAESSAVAAARVHVKVLKPQINSTFCSTVVKGKPFCQRRGPGSSPRHKCPAKPVSSSANQSSRRAEPSLRTAVMRHTDGLLPSAISSLPQLSSSSRCNVWDGAIGS